MHRTKAATILRELCVPLLLFYIVSNGVLGSRKVIRYLDAHQIPGSLGALDETIQFQMLHMRAVRENPPALPEVCFVGSSGVRNGVNAETVQMAWHDRGFPFAAENLGMTFGFAFELPVLKDYFLNPNVSTVVYFYDSFSFDNDLHGAGVQNRWATGEMLRLPASALWEHRDQVFSGVCGEIFSLCRYSGAVRALALHSLLHGPRVFNYPFDYAPDWRAPEHPTQEVPEVDPHGAPFRVAFVGSDTDRPTIGYRAFERFLDLARRRNIQVIVAPIPESDDLDRGMRWGIDVNRIDRRVAQITRRLGGVYLSRSEFAPFNRRSDAFIDGFHLYPVERERFSAWIARRLVPLISVSSHRRLATDAVQ